MKDLLSYFQNKVLSESINSDNISEDANSSLIMNAEKKRQYDPLSNDSTSTQSKRRSSKIRKNVKDTSTDSVNINPRSTDDDSYENDSNKKSKIRKKIRKKSANKKTKGDSFTSSSNKIDSCTASTPKETHALSLRVFKGIVIEDCLNSSSTGSVHNQILDKGVVNRRRKRRKNETDDSEFEDSDSSGNLFENRTIGRPRISTNKSVTRETREENSLLNYFSKAEKPLVSDNRKLQNSPIDCLKRVNVVVDIHSPPKSQSKKAKQVMKSKTDPSPIVKLFRTDTIKPLNLDAIEVIKSEPTNSETLSTRSTQNTVNDQDSDTSIILSNNKRPKVFLKKLVLDDSKSKSGSQTNKCRKLTELKNKKNISSELDDSLVKLKLPVETDYTSSHSKSSDSEDPTWKMRVQFAPKAKFEPRLKRPKSKDEREGSNSSEDEAVMNKANNILKKKRDSNSEPENKSVTTSCRQQKLAPLFCKRYKIDDKKVNNVIDFDDTARKLFLCSGLPDVVKKKFEEQKPTTIQEESYACYRFPTFSHVQQKSENFVWNLPDPELTVKMFEENTTILHSYSHSSYIGKDTKASTYKHTENDFDLKNEIAALKKLESGVNVTDIYASVKRLNKEAGSIDNICWTDKYKPSNFDDLIGNVSSLTKLKEWIESHKRLKIIQSDRDSSSEEFVDSDDSSCDSRKDNVAILVGPSGCGKTCSVYMLAKELGFKVLEVNAASNRNGKRLLDELLEATQSHLVKQTTIFDKAIKNKNSKQKKKKKVVEDRHDQKTRSLILIEDADILFEDHDEGFLSALSTLAKQSKRPLVFIVNDINYPHLTKYRNNLILPFEYPSRSLINVWLKLIALSEGVKLPDAVLVDLFHVAGLDVRKSLLQLQMLISSKLSHSMLNGANSFYQDWCQRLAQRKKMQQHKKSLPKIEKEDPIDDLFSPKKHIVNVNCDDQNDEEIHQCKISESDREANRLLLENHAKFFADIAILGHFESNQEEHIHLCDSKNSPYEDSLSADIRASLERLLFSSFENSKSSVSFSEYYSLIRKNSNIRSVYQNALSNLKVPLNDGYAKYCDFLPALRNITRIEEWKQSNQLKRTNRRFFSYLKSVNICVSDREIEFLRKSMI